MSNQKSHLNQNQQNKKIRFIRAGAGAGKTTTLIRSCLDFIKAYRLSHQKYPKIIITTFTTKATQEIKERLAIEALSENDEQLFQYINKKSSVQIGTIHGVLSLFLKQNSEYIGLSSSFKITDDAEFQFVVKKFLKKYFEENLKYQVLLDHFKFNDLARLFILACVKKIEYSQFRPVSINDLNQSAKAEINRLTDAIENYLFYQNDYPDSWKPSTIFLTQLLSAIKNESKEEIDNAYLLKTNRKYTFKSGYGLTADSDKILAEIFSENIFSDVMFEKGLKIIDELNHLFYELNEKIYFDLENYKRNQAKISISDLELLSYKIMRNYPDSMERFSRQYDFIMVDEYQDTSPLQVEILNQLMQSCEQFIVGDPQQSIYLFRGARSEVFNIKQEEVVKLGFKPEIQNKNYRSSARLMSFINDFFNVYSKQFSPMIPKDQNFSASVFKECTFITAEDDLENAVFQYVNQLIKLGANYSDITILFKKNDPILKFAQKASAVGLPVQIQIAKGFDNKSEIIDLVAVLKFLINPYDTENLIQVLRSPWFDLSDQELIQLRNQKTKSSLSESLWVQLKNAQATDYHFLKELEDVYLQFGAAQALIKFVRKSAFLKASLYFDNTTKRESNIWKFIQTLIEKELDPDFNLSHYINKDFNQINQDLSASTGEGVPLTASNRISLMTVHGSKGLQFEHVIVCGLDDITKTQSASHLTIDESNHTFCLKAVLSDESDKLISTTWSDNIMTLHNDRLRQEDDRLLYVALTRAKTSLALCKKNNTKKLSSNSWSGKINWLSDVYMSDKYSVEFVTYSPIEVNFQKETLNQVSKLKPLASQSIAQKSLSITELVSHQLNDYTTNVITSDASKNTSEQILTTANKAQQGTDLHKYFESLKYNTLDELSPFLNPIEKKSLIWLFEQNHIPLQDILQNGFVEMGFGLQFSDQFVQGQIDAWGVSKDILYIIDYKTGSTKYVEQAFKQLKFYATCLKKMNYMKKGQKVYLVVLYPFDEIIKIQTLNEIEINTELLI